MKLPQFSIGSFVLGIIIAVTIYHGYIVYKMNSAVIMTANQTQINNNRITQIENFLNNSIKKQQSNIKSKKQAPKKVQQEVQQEEQK